MTQMIVHHTVEDYPKWKRVFDEHAEARVRQGSKGYRLLRATSDPNELLIIFDWEDESSGRNFCESAELQEAMVRAGVASEPHIHFWEEIEASDEGQEAERRSA